MRYGKGYAVTQPNIFYPERRAGLIFHLAVLLLLGTMGVVGIGQASQAQGNLSLLSGLLMASVAMAFGPLFLYRMYALWFASYALERDGIRLRWGLRAADLPMDTILWVRRARQVNFPLPLPVWRWPGAVLGSRSTHDRQPVEYLASQTRTLLVIATPQRLYGISPADPDAFIQKFQELTELGSLTPFPAQSVYPKFVLGRSWNDPLARVLLLAGLILSLALLAGVILMVPSLAYISLRPGLTGQAGERAPAARLLLLPALNLFFVLADTLSGLFFYRREETRPLAYLMWGAGILVSLLFLGAVVFILRAS